MVYSGKPSTGCYLCRRRKIKCDEARPGCRNCEIYGKECPGYRPSIVHDKGYSIRKWKSSVANDRRLNAIIADEATPDFDPADALALMPKPRWLADATMEDRALCYFFYQYTTPKGPDGVPGALESIPLLYILSRENEVAGSPSSCLRWAVEAAALTSFAHESDDRKLDLQAREKYVMAIHGLKEALSTPVEKVQDGTLAAILLLVIFEDINGERPQLLSSHTAGLELVARLHTYRRLDSKYSRCLFNFAYVQLHIQILLGSRPKLDLHFLLDRLDHSDPLQSLMCIVTKLSQLILDVPALVDDSGRSLLDTETVSIGDLISYYSQVQSLDEELGLWCRTIPGQWLPRIIYSTSGEALVTYASFSAGSLWNFYRCARIFAHSMMDSLNTVMMARSMADDGTGDNWSIVDLSSSFHSQSTTYEIVQNLITDICKSIPFLLGDIDSNGNPFNPRTTAVATSSSSSCSSSPSPPGSINNSCLHMGSNTAADQTNTSARLKAIEGYEMLWPFWHIMNSRFSTPKQRVQAQTSLYRLDHDLGIKLASKLADVLTCNRYL